MLNWLAKASLYIVSFVAFVYSGVMGVFGAAGMCYIIWGDDILHTALGKPPDYGHPAFYLWMLLMVPSMLIGFTGGFFLVVLPLYSAFRLRVLDSPGNIRAIRGVCNWYVQHLQRLLDNLV